MISDSKIPPENTLAYVPIRQLSSSVNRESVNLLLFCEPRRIISNYSPKWRWLVVDILNFYGKKTISSQIKVAETSFNTFKRPCHKKDCHKNTLSRNSNVMVPRETSIIRELKQRQRRRQ